MRERFSYQDAFSRNIGWITEEEQAILRSKRIAIAGMGGVGGSHLLTLTRLGVGGFNLSDFDKFEIVNFNRQAGATISSINRPKLDVLVDMALDINPELDINIFPDGVSGYNAHAFLDNVDLYIDGLDFFAIEARCRVFSACSALGIPATTVAPLGMGAALLNFLPGKMTFEEYFQLDGLAEFEQLLRFLVGLAPKMLHSNYLVEPGSVDLHEQRVPSTPMGCELSAGVAATQALKILLNRGKVIAAPQGLQFDAFRNKTSRTWRPWGAKNPLQVITFKIAKSKLNKFSPRSAKTEDKSTKQLSTIEKILDYARWAPSGDNSQPWRFEISGNNKVTIHGHDTRTHCVYDLQGHASQLALGALLETVLIAASQHNYEVNQTIRKDKAEETPTIDLEFHHVPGIKVSPLLPYIKRRCVQRRALSTRTIEPYRCASLDSTVKDGYELLWFDGIGNRIRFSKLLFKNGQLRLKLPEAYPTHKNIIHWNRKKSEDKIPDQAIGASNITLHMIHWAMQSWKRISFMNRYLGGSIVPGIELDLLPALFCGAHFVLVANNTPETVIDYINAGKATQRLWLTASRLGLFIQPAYIPLVFHEYVRKNINFTNDSSCIKRVKAVSDAFCSLIGENNANKVVFMGRIGYGVVPNARSIRLPLKKLLITSPE